MALKPFGERVKENIFMTISITVFPPIFEVFLENGKIEFKSKI